MHLRDNLKQEDPGLGTGQTEHLRLVTTVVHVCAHVHRPTWVCVVATTGVEQQVLGGSHAQEPVTGENKDQGPATGWNECLKPLTE